MNLRLNPDASFSIFSDASNEKRWLCCIPLPDGKEYRATLPQFLYEFICHFKQESTFKEVQELIKVLGDKEQQKYEALLNQFLLPKGILLSQSSGFSTPYFVKGRPAHMQFQLPVFRPVIVNLFSSLLQYIFMPAVLLISIIVAVFSQLYFYASIEPSFTNIWQLTALEQIQIILIVGLGLFIHELGHAAAAYKFGCRNIDIGVGWYICFLVFYAELSESWRLSRRQRVLIDCGGMIFQSIFTALLIALQFQSNSTVIFYAIIMLNISFIWNLNPFFRMDGYWIASDLLGIANLRTTAQNEFYSLFAMCFKQQQEKKVTQLPTKTKKLLLLYTIMSNLFFCCMIYIVGVRLITMLNETLPNKYNELESAYVYSTPAINIFVTLTGGIFQIMMLTFFCVFLYKSFTSFLRILQTARKFIMSEK